MIDRKGGIIEHNIPLDDFDYELARRADERGKEGILIYSFPQQLS
jgi:hypothetical protein